MRRRRQDVAQAHVGAERVVLAPDRQLDEHPLEGGRDDDEHLGVLVRPARGQADVDRRVVAGGAGGRGDRLHAPRADRHLDHQLVLGVARLGGEGEADDVAVGHLERLERHLVDAVAFQLDRLREDLVATAGVHAQLQGGWAGDADVVHPRMNRGLSPCVKAEGTLRSTKKSLRTVIAAVVWPTRVSEPVTPRAVNW